MAHQIINLIRNSADDDYDINWFTRRLAKLDFNENKILKKNSKIVFFLVTKSYLNSNLFKIHLTEANTLNKEIVIILLEKELFLDPIEFSGYKIFSFYEAIRKSFDGYSIFEKCDDFDANECFQHLKKILRRKTSVSFINKLF